MSEPQTPASRMAYAQQMLAIIDKRLVELPYEATWETRLSLTDARKHYIIMFEQAVNEFSNAWYTFEWGACPRAEMFVGTTLYSQWKRKIKGALSCHQKHPKQLTSNTSPFLTRWCQSLTQARRMSSRLTTLTRASSSRKLANKLGLVSEWVHTWAGHTGRNVRVPDSLVKTMR